MIAGGRRHRRFQRHDPLPAVACNESDGRGRDYFYSSDQLRELGASSCARRPISAGAGSASSSAPKMTASAAVAPAKNTDRARVSWSSSTMCGCATSSRHCSLKVTRQSAPVTEKNFISIRASHPTSSTRHGGRGPGRLARARRRTRPGSQRGRQGEASSLFFRFERVVGVERRPTPADFLSLLISIFTFFDEWLLKTR